MPIYKILSSPFLGEEFIQSDLNDTEKVKELYEKNVLYKTTYHLDWEKKRNKKSISNLEIKQLEETKIKVTSIDKLLIKKINI